MSYDYIDLSWTELFFSHFRPNSIKRTVMGTLTEV